MLKSVDGPSDIFTTGTVALASVLSDAQNGNGFGRLMPPPLPLSKKSSFRACSRDCAELPELPRLSFRGEAEADLADAPSNELLSDTVNRVRESTSKLLDKVCSYAAKGPKQVADHTTQQSQSTTASKESTPPASPVMTPAQPPSSPPPSSPLRYGTDLDWLEQKHVVLRKMQDLNEGLSPDHPHNPLGPGGKAGELLQLRQEVDGLRAHSEAWRTENTKLRREVTALQERVAAQDAILEKLQRTVDLIDNVSSLFPTADDSKSSSASSQADGDDKAAPRPSRWKTRRSSMLRYARGSVATRAVR